MKFTVIIPTWNNFEYLYKCLQSIDNDGTLDSDREIIVVCQPSQDYTLEYLAQWKLKAGNRKVIFNGENTGWCGGINQGMAEARGDYLVMLNDDTQVMVGWLNRMAAQMRSAKAGLCGPLSNAVPGEQYQPLDDIRQMPMLCAKLPHTSKETEFLSGFCMMVSRETVDKIGYLDERFNPGGYDDNDYVLRATQEGIKAIIDQSTFIWHEGSVTLDREYPELNRGMSNYPKFVDKHKEYLLKKNDGFVRGLTVAIICKNEGANIDQFASAIWPWVERMVFVDTGSTDNTRERAEIYGQVVECKTADLAEARNTALKLCGDSWVLAIDVDETLDPTEWGRVRRCVNDPVAQAFKVRILNQTRDGRQFPQFNIRLFKSDAGEWKNEVHENFVPKDGAVVDNAEFSIIHFGYLKPNRVKHDADYYEGIRRALKVNPDNGFLWFQKAMCHLQKPNEQEAARIALANAVSNNYPIALKTLVAMDLLKCLENCQRLMERLEPDHVVAQVTANAVQSLTQALNDLQGVE
jgi:GT2 family glycosyltransferase